MASLVLILLGFFLPTQLGLHLWPSWSYVYGLRIDYLSPTIYLTDILLLVILVLNSKKVFSVSRKHLTASLLFISFVFLNTVFSAGPPVSLIAWFRFLLLLNLINYLTNQPLHQLRLLLLGLSASVIIIVSLALAQLAHQGSVDGLFYWLGERRFSITTPGIARLNLPNIYDLRSKILLLRPYSVFGHPNALGGFALVTYFLLSNIYHLKSNILARLAIPFALLGVIISFSKTAILGLVIILIFKKLQLSSKLVFGASFVGALLATFLPVFVTSLAFGRSLIDRHYLLNQAIQIFQHSPIIGAGLGAFITSQGSLGLGLQGAFIYLQPVHNLLLLLLSEIGILGTGLGLIIIYKLVINSKLEIRNYRYLLSAVILTGSSDHYWLTLQQPRLLLAVIIGLALNKRFSK